MLQSDDVRRADYAAGFGLADIAADDKNGVFKTEILKGGGTRNIMQQFRSLGLLQ